MNVTQRVKGPNSFSVQEKEEKEKNQQNTDAREHKQTKPNYQTQQNNIADLPTFSGHSFFSTKK